MEWQNTDPREIGSNHSHIVIMRPALSGYGHWMCGLGYFDSKHEYYIHTDFEDYKNVDEWNSDWWWIYAPENKR